MNLDLRLEKSVKEGQLVCPRTKKNLKIEGDTLVTGDGKFRYPLDEGVPILLSNKSRAKRYVESGSEMVQEYDKKRIGSENFVDRLRARFNQYVAKDYRTAASIEALSSELSRLNSDSVALSVGGGPLRVDSRLTNVNIDKFLNVDVVADAHELPYADNTVDFIHCEAVLEHLKSPQKAVKEMLRVLKSGGTVFAATPFIAPYHGYPNHFQNFTLTGHCSLFEKQGFKILKSGTCVGPVFTLTVVVGQFIDEYFPKTIRRLPKLSWKLASLLLRPMDQFLNDRENSHVLASTTFLLAQKI